MSAARIGGAPIGMRGPAWRSIGSMWRGRCTNPGRRRATAGCLAICRFSRWLPERRKSRRSAFRCSGSRGSGPILASICPPPNGILRWKRSVQARRLLAAFLPRAFRRPVGPEEVEPYARLLDTRLAAGDCFEDAMRRSVVAILTSPEFLFHSPDTASDPWSRACRLSYWLWNAPPDETLVATAISGGLNHPQRLRAEVDRLLDSPKSGQFIDDFADQWLELRRIDETIPDRDLYPEYSHLLHEGMVAETRAFVRELIAENLPISTLVSADFAFLTQRLAEHYSIADVEGTEVRRVSLPAGSHRGGLLTQAAILKLTANGTTTSPVKRGKWVIDRLLNAPPAPPPPTVAAIEPDTRGSTTIREQLARHQASASCAACHAQIDPAGFALEAFDPVGGFRTRYRACPVGRGLSARAPGRSLRPTCRWPCF